MLTSGPLRHLVRNAARLSRPSVVLTRCMSHDYHDDHHKSAVQVARDSRGTLNDLPIPAGSWQEDHSKRNSSYNIILAAGVITLIATFIVMKQSGTLYLHGMPDYKKVNIDPK